MCTPLKHSPVNQTGSSKNQLHWSRSTRQLERDAAILVTVGLQFKKQESGFFRLQKIEKRNEEDSSSTGTPTGVSV